MHTAYRLSHRIWWTLPTRQCSLTRGRCLLSLWNVYLGRLGPAPSRKSVFSDEPLQEILCCDWLEESELKRQERGWGRRAAGVEILRAGWPCLLRAESLVGLLEAGTYEAMWQKPAGQATEFFQNQI